MPQALPILASPPPRTAYAALPPRDPHAAVPALYIHVPFCTTKCHYCDFYSLAGHLHLADDYLAALATEIALQTAHFGTPAPETIFIGGGTPTLLDPARLDRLLTTLRHGINPASLREFTIEANPNTFCPDRARVLASHGVNRISFGAQSFLPHELAILQRDHNPESVAPAVAIARNAGITNINLDLIFGTPNQTLADWDYSLQHALALHPTHLSAYSLIYEPNTAMTARMHKGEFATLDESAELAIFQHTYDTLRAAGFERYEVSNYAKAEELSPSHFPRRCLHNLHYWKGSNFLAFGPSAAAGYQGRRWKNVQNLTHYLDALHGPQPVIPAIQMEHLPPARRAGELAMLWLRLAEGMDYAEFQARTAIDPRPRVARILKKYDGLGFLDATPTRLRFTDAGIPVSDAILADLLQDFQ